MPTTLEKCDPDVRELMNELIEDHYPDLKEAGVSIELLAARNSKGAPLNLHGYPCAAVVKVNSYADRVEGKDDATIKIDVEAWETTPDDRRRAILDHELYHLVVKRKNGEVVTDDVGRPKFELRLHDMVVGGFAEIVARHGEDALDHGHLLEAHRQLHKTTGRNYEFEFDDDGRLIRGPRLHF